MWCWYSNTQLLGHESILGRPLDPGLLYYLSYMLENVESGFEFSLSTIVMVVMMMVKMIRSRLTFSNFFSL